MKQKFCIKVFTRKLLQDLPEIANCENDTDRFKIFSEMPYAFGNFIATVWNLRNELLSKRVYNNLN